jgi:hypothetical protein
MNSSKPERTDAFPLAAFLEVADDSRAVRIPRATDTRTHLSVYGADSTGAAHWFDLTLIATSVNGWTIIKPAGLVLSVRDYGTPDSD